MSTCCGGNGDVILAAKAALAGIMASPVEAGKVRLEYVGDNVGAISFFGKNGVVYRGGKNDIEGFIDAHEADVDFLLSTGKWQRARNVVSLAPHVEPEPKVEVHPHPQYAGVALLKSEQPKDNGNGREVEKPLDIDDDMTPEQEAALNAQINQQMSKAARRGQAGFAVHQADQILGDRLDFDEEEEVTNRVTRKSRRK